VYNYKIIVYWSDEDRLFIAEVPDLPGCVTHGDTRAEVLAMAKEAIMLWIETAKEFGVSMPEAGKF
jgi:predicted RNase H-like HicB family nuclease